MNKNESIEAAQAAALKSGEILFSALPADLQDKLLLMQKEPPEDVITITQESKYDGLCSLIIVPIIAGLLAYATSDSRWDIWGAIGTACWMTIAVAWFLNSLCTFAANNTGSLLKGLYLTRAYIIETHAKFVRIMPLYAITAITRVDNYDKNKSYVNSSLKIAYANSEEEIISASTTEAEIMRQKLIDRINQLQTIQSYHDRSYLNEVDIFKEVTLKPMYSIAGSYRRIFWVRALISLILACGIAAVLWNWNLKCYAAPPPAMQPIEFPAGKEEVYYTLKADSKLGRAILKIKNNSGNTLIKLQNNDTDQVIYVAYMGAGSTKIRMLPPGDYILHTASGSNWYGDEYLFGEHTFYIQTDQPMKLQNGSISDITIGVRDGNLNTKKIRPSEFKNLNTPKQE